MRFSPAALIVLVAFFAVLAFALAKGPAAVHAAEAVVTALIVAGLGGLAFRHGHRSR